MTHLLKKKIKHNIEMWSGHGDQKRQKKHPKNRKIWKIWVVFTWDRSHDTFAILKKKTFRSFKNKKI